MMTQFRAHIPYASSLEDLVDEITAQAPQASGFETDEILVVCDRVRSAATVASQTPFEVVRAADESEFFRPEFGFGISPASRPK